MSVDGKSEQREIAQLFMEHFKVHSPLGPSAEVIDAEFYLQGDEPSITCVCGTGTR